MTPQELYEIWSPPGSLWSPWAKPVLFAQMNLGKYKPDEIGSTNIAPEQVTFEPQENLDWVRDYRSDTAIVLDLPAETAVETSLQMANYGFRPVPLYNCANTDMGNPIVPVAPIISALARSAPLLSTFGLSPDALPAFLLDSRRNSNIAPQPMDFDNRWVIFPQDFPSATFLKSRGIRRILVLQEKRTPIVSSELHPDLYEVARRWHGSGLEIDVRETAITAPLPSQPAPVYQYEDYGRPLTFGPLSRFRLGANGVAWTMYAMAARRSSGGGFGRIIPHPSSTGGG